MGSPLDDMINQASETVGAKLRPAAKQAVEGVIRNIFDQGMLPKEAMGISDTVMEGIYGHAYRMYNAGQYRDAQSIFRILTMLNPLESKYAMGSGACLHMMKDYKTAAAIYTITSSIDPKNPVPHYHASDCYLKMSLIGAAMNELKTTIELCGDQPVYAIVRDRSKMMLERLEQGDVDQPTENGNEL
jgi:type III secretion system low calcium response chaperone LcrH/SycD